MICKVKRGYGRYIVTIQHKGGLHLLTGVFQTKPCSAVQFQNTVYKLLSQESVFFLFSLFLQQHGSVYWKRGARQTLTSLHPNKTFTEQLKVTLCDSEQRADRSERRINIISGVGEGR